MNEPDEGGKPLNKGGYCYFYCSPSGYCGDGEDFIEHNMVPGIDCSACNIDNEGKICNSRLLLFYVLLPFHDH